MKEKKQKMLSTNNMCWKDENVWARGADEWRFATCTTGQLNLFTETAVTPERKVEKSFPRSEINRHAEG